MERKYYERMKKEFDEILEPYRDDYNTVKALKRQLLDGKYSRSYKNTLQPKINELTLEMLHLRDKAQKNIDNQLAEKLEELKYYDVLKPDELNASEMALLNSGISLTQNDLDKMIERNADNRTMLQLIFKYARDNNVRTTYRFKSAEMLGQHYKEAAQSASRLVNWLSNMDGNGFDKMYNSIMAEGGLLESAVDDD